jgi:hypothetical protein
MEGRRKEEKKGERDEGKRRRKIFSIKLSVI